MSNASDPFKNWTLSFSEKLLVSPIPPPPLPSFPWVNEPRLILYASKTTIPEMKAMKGSCEERLWRPWARSYNLFFWLALLVAVSRRARQRLRGFGLACKQQPYRILSVVALFCWPRARDFLGVAELQMCWKLWVGHWLCQIWTLLEVWDYFGEEIRGWKKVYHCYKKAIF